MSTQPYNRAANTAASAIIQKNGSRAALIGRALEKDFSTRLSVGGINSGAITNEQQGSAFISSAELSNILIENTPPGKQRPPLPAGLPPGPFPSKAYFSPNGAPTEFTDLQFNFGTQSNMSTIFASNYNISYVVPSAIYAQRYDITVRDPYNIQLSSISQITNPSQIQISLSNQSLSTNVLYTNVKATNKFGSSTNRITLADPYINQVLSKSIISYNNINNNIYLQIQNIADSYYFEASVSNIDSSLISSLQTITSNNNYYINISNLSYDSTYFTNIFTTNFRTKQYLSYSTYIPNYSYYSSDILGFARNLASNNYIPTGLNSTYQININGSLFGFDYYKSPFTTPVTLNSFYPDTIFTNTRDSNSAWLIFNCNVIIAPGVTLIPPVRKLFTVLYVKGNLTVDGTISMTARGAANISGQNIQIGDSTRSGTLNNYLISATGAAGAHSRIIAGANNGSNSTATQTGGGGGGYARGNYEAGPNKDKYIASAGSGSAGTSFSGGSASGGNYTSISQNTSTLNASINGGSGSAGINGGSGAGNPGGSNGTGGTLIIIVDGQISGNGTIRSQGSTGGNGTAGGGGSGGGNVTVLYNTRSLTYPSLNTAGGLGGIGTSGRNGGNGGSGGSNYIQIS